MYPSEIFTEFFQWYKLREVHTRIELLFKIALTTDNGNYDDPKEREELFFFKEELMKCIDAARRLALI
jgi:hypothetical protein